MDVWVNAGRIFPKALNEIGHVHVLKNLRFWACKVAP